MERTPEETRSFRTAMGEFATGVTVVSCWDGDTPKGTTVNSFTSVSLDPPLILVSLLKGGRTLDCIRHGDFTVDILAEDADGLARHFAGRPEPVTVEWDLNGSSPRLPDSLGWFRCCPWAAYDGGDHELIVGEVEDFSITGGGPLLFHRGSMQGLTPSSA